MEIKKELVNENKYECKCPYGMVAEGITVHNTANDASARNEASYMKSNNNEVSFHIAVDDVEVIQLIDFNRNAWHAGDGGNGFGNRKTIAIEICYSKSGGDRFIKAEKNASIIVAKLLKEFGWGFDRVYTHQKHSGKYCPHRTLDSGWDRFMNMVKEAYNGTMQGDQNNSTSAKQIYRVRKSWSDATSQKGAFSDLNNAKKCADQNKGYSVFDDSGNSIYSKSNSESEVLERSYLETGVATVIVDTLGVKNEPNSESSSVATYYRGEKINYDSVYVTNKYYYISYVSESGIRRYVASRSRAGEQYLNCI